MGRKWILLVDEDGEPLTSTTSVSVEIEDVDMLRKVVKNKFQDSYLVGIAASDLTVYGGQAAFDAEEKPLMASSLVTKSENTRSYSGFVNLIACAQRFTSAQVGTIVKYPNKLFGTTLDNGLFIRQEYVKLHNIINNTWTSNDSITRVLVLGSPGICKSVFGIYLLLNRMSKHQDVAYHPIYYRNIYYLTWNRQKATYVVTDEPLEGRMCNDAFFDGREIGEAFVSLAFKYIFLLASPRTTNYNQFVKGNCFKVYKNPWTKAECQSFANAISVGDEDEWIRRNNLVGGRPRYLFSSTWTYDELIHEVKRGVPSNFRRLEAMVQDLDRDVYTNEMNRIVLLLFRNGQGRRAYRIEYASMSVETIIDEEF